MAVTITDGAATTAASASYLGMGYTEYLAEIARLTGFDSTDATSLTMLQSVMDGGLRQFYNAHPWNFLEPEATLTTVADTSEYDLPADFGEMQGPLYYGSEKFYSPLRYVPIGRIRALQATDDFSHIPYCFAVVPKTSAMDNYQRWSIVLYNTPPEVWTFTYRYAALQSAIRTATPYPLGGPRMTNAILSSMLAYYELNYVGAPGVYTAQWQADMEAAKAIDFRTKPRNLGPGVEEPDRVNGTRMRVLDGPVTFVET